MRKITILFMCFFALATMMGNVQEVTPDIMLKTDKFAGESILLSVEELDGVVYIDWGDGSVEQFDVEITWPQVTQISKVLSVDQPTIKIYGKIVYFIAENQALTSFELVNLVPTLRALKVNDNMLTKVKGLSKIGTNCGEIRMQNNYFSACDIEEMYNEIGVNKFNSGAVFMIHSNYKTYAQYQHVIDSKISIINAKGYRVTDAAFGFTTAYNNPITETTGIGCVSAGLNKIENKNFELFFDPKSQILSGKTTLANGCDLFIYDLCGKVIFNQSLKEEEFSISAAEWPKGIYLIKLNNYVQKVVIN